MFAIREPLHGAVLNRRHGKVEGDRLHIAVRGDAPRDAEVTVNGLHARRAGDTFSAEVALTERETDLVAAAESARGREEHRVRVVWDRRSKPRYRFSIDDNIFFLRDLAARRPASLFDSPYLAGLRKLRRAYGVKFALNCFRTTPEKDFELAQMPDRWRGEWADNADWLKLSFHADCEFPDRPYQHASAETLGRDFDRVAGEIHRFAGEASWSVPTVVHWAIVHPAAMTALTSRGVRALSGFFMPDTGSSYTDDDAARVEKPPFRYDVNYWLDNARSEYLSRHDALKDFATGIVYSRVDLVCNLTPVEKVAPTLESLTHDPNTAEIMDVFTHEQYFWPFYHNYRPDHWERCEAAIRFCSERGYAPVFFHEGFLGGEE